MPSIRLSAVHLLVLAALPLVGCGDSRDASWPAGTDAVVSAPEARDIIARVPKDQQNKIPRDALVVASQTPVVIVDDSVSRAVKARRWWGTSPTDPVRVRIAKGHQGIEVFVRRGELTPGQAADAWAIPLVPAAVLLLFAAAGVLWTVETVVLLFLRMRMRSDGTELHLGSLPLQTLATVLWRSRGRSRRIERTDEDCERWREWIAEKTARRKAICARLRARRLQNGSGVG
jgi:hypothetical protein